MLVLLFFSIGAIVAIVCLLFKRRNSLQEEATQKYFGLLYLIYKPDRYY